jgi:hypothetical protein
MGPPAGDHSSASQAATWSSIAPSGAMGVTTGRRSTVARRSGPGGESRSPSPTRRARSASASPKFTPWVVITRSAAVPPAEQAWQRHRSWPDDEVNMLTGGVRPV